MPRLIDTRGAVLANPWLLCSRDATLDPTLAEPAAHLLVNLQLWQGHKQAVQDSGRQLAVWLDSDQPAGPLAQDLAELPLVALNFPGFKDGRSYSTAVVLRQHYHYAGEIRAIGDVLRDQLIHMQRCGFTTFDLKDSVRLEDAATAFADFKDSYQSTVIEPRPLFRRRV
jgi:uncharacterized protein (DUF934 family)